MKLRWWLSWILLAIFIGIASIFLRYINNDDDLVQVMDALNARHLPDQVAGLNASPPATISSLLSISAQVTALNADGSVFGYLEEETWPWLFDAHGLIKDRAKFLALARRWDESSCRRIEMAVDGLGARPILRSSRFGDDGTGREGILQFLICRLLSADPSRLLGCEQRLVRFMLTCQIGPINNSVSTNFALCALAGCPRGSSSDDEAVARLIEAFKAALLDNVRLYKASEIIERCQQLRLGGKAALRRMSVEVPDVEMIGVVAAWDVRRWRQEYLMNLISTYDELGSFDDVIKGAQDEPSRRTSSRLVVESMADGSRYGRYECKSLARRILLAEIAISGLRRRPLPRDPFDQKRNILRTVVIHGVTVLYSVGPDGRDDGGTFPQDLSLCSVPAPAGADPQKP